MSHDSDLQIFPSLCLKWRVAVGNTSPFGTYNSKLFRFQGKQRRLVFGFLLDNYCLALQNVDGGFHEPFDAVVDVENGAGRILPGLKVVTHRKHPDFPKLWKKTEADVVRAYPAFGQSNHELRFRVLLKAGAAVLKDEECTCAMCQFTAADDTVASLESFSKDLGDLLDQDDSADVEFRCVDADDKLLTTVKAHKCVVSARSPVLASMLHSDMVEGRTGVATIRDIDADVFMQFLKYLYSGKLDETTMDTAMSLYEAGDRFQVKSLTRHCARRMARNLTIEKSCEVLLLADSHCDEELSEATVTFMVNAKVPHVFDGWEDFCSKHPSLFIKVLNRFCKLFKGTSPEGESSCSKRRRIA